MTSYHKQAKSLIRSVCSITDLRSWMHDGEYEGSPEDMCDYGDKPMTCAQWVDTMHLDDLRGYIIDKVNERDLDDLDEFMGDWLEEFGWTRPPLDTPIEEEPDSKHGFVTEFEEAWRDFSDNLPESLIDARFERYCNALVNVNITNK